MLMCVHTRKIHTRDKCSFGLLGPISPQRSSFMGVVRSFPRNVCRTIAFCALYLCCAIAMHYTEFQWLIEEPGTTRVVDKLGSTFSAGRLPTDDVE